MNIPIFFFSYLIGYLLTAYCLGEGVKVYRGHPQEWQLRRAWWYRAITDTRYNRVAIGILSLSWPYLLLGTLIHMIRQGKTDSDEFDFNRIRHCSDPLYQWCEASPYAVIYVTVMRCEHDNYPLCTLALARGDFRRCYDFNNYDRQLCQGVALQ